ncbi:hypothetical protein QWZ13_11235 [Reinekea marina]|uniref:hypothetical protein n=1 Tax=Reinekea marina TaxID=1310421 RepID=UPI0025B33CAA|nr:hypothetical protein [Reinekea marina]MDN3649487.1 hypothetical protein [Reinekea marina]
MYAPAVKMDVQKHSYFCKSKPKQVKSHGSFHTKGQPKSVYSVSSRAELAWLVEQFTRLNFAYVQFNEMVIPFETKASEKVRNKQLPLYPCLFTTI